MSGESLSLQDLCAHLLYNHECVVIPGMGGFIVRDSPCNFNAGLTKIKPFARHIFFNPHLNQNDGLLAAEVMKRNGMDYASAMAFCSAAAETLQNDITSRGSYKFGNLGTFFKGQEHIWFAPATELNLSFDSYGLEPVDIRVLESESVAAELPVVRPLTLADNTPIEALEPERTQGAGIRPWLIAASVALVVHFAYLVFEQPYGNNHVASVVPTISMPDSDVSATYADTSASFYTDNAGADTSVASTPEAPVSAEIAPVAQTPEALPAVEPASAPKAITPAITPSPEMAPAEPKVAVTAEPAPAEMRVARYKMEANAQWHKKDLQKKGSHARVQQNGDWFEVFSSSAEGQNPGKPLSHSAGQQ